MVLGKCPVVGTLSSKEEKVEVVKEEEVEKMLVKLKGEEEVEKEVVKKNEKLPEKEERKKRRYFE